MSHTAEYWNDDAGPRWVAQAVRVDAQIGPLGAAALEHARVRPGDSVVEIGCGCGGATLQIAERVRDTGRVHGVDVSAVMLRHARHRAKALGFDHVDFVQADAQTYAFEPASAQHVFSRFGVMFFEEPAEAFSNIRSVLSPDGRLTFVCWADMERNPWVTVPREAAGRHVELADPTDETEPGPFSLARPERIETLLGRAGFHQPVVTPLEGELLFGGPGDLDGTVDFALQIGPAATALKDAPASARRAVAASVRETLAPYLTAEGVSMPYKAWVVTAGP